MFKDNFQDNQGALLKCKKQYEQTLRAVEKVDSYKKDDQAVYAKDIPKKPGKKLAWGLGMSSSEFSDFEGELEESYKIAIMAQCIVQLVVLQVHSQQFVLQYIAPTLDTLTFHARRELTLSETVLLRKVKKATGGLLEFLHETGVGSVMVFSLTEPLKPANTTQIAKAAEEQLVDNASISTASIIIRSSSPVNTPATLKNG